MRVKAYIMRILNSHPFWMSFIISRHSWTDKDRSNDQAQTQKTEEYKSLTWSLDAVEDRHNLREECDAENGRNGSDDMFRWSFFAH